MNGECLVVEQVGGASYQSQTVDETDARLSAFKFHRYHGTGGGAELPLCQRMVRVILQPYIIYVPDIRLGTELFRNYGGIAGLYPVTCIQRLQSDGLHVGYMRGHISTQVEKHFRTHASAEFGTGPIIHD